MKVEGQDGEHRQVPVYSEHDPAVDRLVMTGEIWTGGRLWGDALVERTDIKGGARTARYAVARFPR
jgi:hypothetical protein